MADKKVKIIYEVDDAQLERANQLMGRTATNTDKADKEIKDFGKDAKKAGADTEKAFKGAGDSVSKLGKTVSTQKKPFLDLSSTISKVGATVAGAFAFSQIISFGKRVIEVTSQFQKFEAVLTNTLGSQVLAQAALAEIQQAAAKTNFSVSELTDSYIKFANRGVKLTQAELLKLTDVANSTGKSFDQLTEAVLDSFTGENERLKEFGIIAHKTGETTQFTFKGITTEVKNTQEAIKNYLIGLGDLQGVSGSTAAISATLEGRISNLGDAYDQLLLSLGRLSTGILPDLISGFTDFINLSAMAFKSTEQIINDVNALSIASTIREDATEVANLAKAYEKNGRSISDATKKAANDVILSLDKILNGWDVLTEQQRQSLTERIAQIRKTFITEKENVDSQLGLLGQLRKELKEVQDQREKSKSEAEIKAFNEREIKINNEIKRLSELGKTIEVTRKKLKELFSLDPKAAFENTNELIKDQTEKYNKAIGDQINARADQANFEDQKRQESLEKEKLYRDNQKKMYIESFFVAVDLINNIAALEDQKTLNKISNLQKEKDRQILAAGENTKARIAIESDFDKRILALKREQFERDKRLATLNAFINIAQGVTKAYAQGGFAGILLGTLVAAAGAVQISAINKQQPQFNKGTKSVPGPHTNRDSVEARLTPGEMVFPLPTKKKYQPILNAIFDHKISPKFLNDIANGKHSGGGITVLKDNKDVVDAIEGLPISNFNWDEDGVTKYVEKKGSRTQYLNRRFKVK